MINAILNDSSAETLRYYRDGQAVFHRDFIALIRKYCALAAALPESEVILSTEDIYFFNVGLLALLAAGKRAVIPSFYRDNIREEIAVSQLFTDRNIAGAVVLSDCDGDYTDERLEISPDARLDFYTSGSTGEPKKVSKRFANMEAEALYLSKLFADAIARKPVVVSTVDINHMYGIFYHFLVPLYNGLPAETKQIFTPEQLQAVFARYNKLFIASSPAFLTRIARYKDEYSFSSIPVAISTAGGALEAKHAKAVRYQLCIYPTEIFGSTETGGVAYKKNSETWTLYEPVRAERGENGGLLVHSPFIDEPFELADRVEFIDDRQFTLQGRVDRLVKFEEKRVSLPELENEIKAQEGVREAYCVLVDAAPAFIGACITLESAYKAVYIDEGKAAFVARLKRALVSKLDPVIIPSRWRIVEELPINSQGKVQKNEVIALFSNNLAEPIVLQKQLSEDELRLQLCFMKDAIYFRGHFPAVPILPGVAQSHFAIHWARRFFDSSINVRKLTKLKFTNVIKPDIAVTLSLKKRSGGYEFSYSSDEKLYSSGILHV